jgi:hypothetical protein
MKLTLLYILFFLFGTATEKANLPRQHAINFKLEYVRIGFGSNMWTMQPVFRVHGTTFVYTSEEVWIIPEQKEIRRDTLLTGDLRITAVDSIKNLIGAMKDSVIYRSGAILSGSKSYITVTTNDKEISFQLHNASDTTAEKIVDILNSHIPAGYRKLHIFNPKQNRSKNQPTSSPS